MSFWTYGLQQSLLFNPLTATGKAIYDVYAQIKNAPIDSTPWYKDLFGLQTASSAINTAKDTFKAQTGAIAESVGGLSQGVADIGSGFKTATTEYPKMFETGAKYGTLSIAIIGAVALVYLLKK